MLVVSVKHAILMRMKESCNWFTNFIVSFVICFLIHLFIAAIYTLWFGVNGNDFGVVLVFFILCLIVEIWFQFFITTLIKNASKGKQKFIIEPEKLKL